MSPGPGCGAPCVCWDHYHVKMGYRAITRRPALLITAIWSDYPHTPPPQYTFLIGCRPWARSRDNPFICIIAAPCSAPSGFTFILIQCSCHICLKSESPQVRGNSIPGLGNPILWCLHLGSGYSQVAEVAPLSSAQHKKHLRLFFNVSNCTVVDLQNLNFFQLHTFCYT